MSKIRLYISFHIYLRRRFVRVDKRFRTSVRPSERVRAVAEAFGIGLDEERVFTVFRAFSSI
ncbi:MAG: hypothetical protein QXQ37_03540 [Nitrososphaerota archaeon]